MEILERTIGGTIYAPTSHVTMNGNASIGDDVEFGVQVIADTIKVSGNANLDFNYTGEDLYIGDITLEIAK